MLTWAIHELHLDAADAAECQDGREKSTEIFWNMHVLLIIMDSDSENLGATFMEGWSLRVELIETANF